MELCTFAIEDGFPEALVRGQKLVLLKDVHYEHLKTLPNLAEVKSYLEEECDYSDVWENSNVLNVTDTSIKRGLEKRVADEFEFFEKNSVGSLHKFLWYLRVPYMIDNTVSMIEGIRNHKKEHDLDANLNPLGIYPELRNLKSEKEDPNVLYETVLVESPLCDYFLRLLEGNTAYTKMEQIGGFFQEKHAEVLRSVLKKFWIEDFIQFCEGLNGISADNMIHLLKTEADFMTINVIYNTFKDEKKQREEQRKFLLPACGYFYPDCHYHFLKECDTFDDLKAKCAISKRYQDIVDNIPDPTQEAVQTNAPSIDDLMMKERIRLHRITYDEQANYSVFMSYLELRNQEIKNINWLCSCITTKLDKGNAAWKKIIQTISEES